METENTLDLGYILEEELTGDAEGLNMGLRERSEDSKDNY